MGKDQVIIIIILFNLFFILFIVGIVIFIRQYKLKKKEHNVMLQNQTEAHQKELLSTQIEIQRQTMQHIGREIHDNVGQKLTLASLYTQQLAFENKAPYINDNIENISKIINDSLSELRELSKTLTDNTIESNTIYQLISSEVKKVKDLNLCQIDLVFNVNKSDIPYSQKTILYRISQEFIQNSIKHSNCKLIHLELIINLNNVQLILQDDGIGFDKNAIQSNGIGLSNMKKRVELVGGNFDLQSNTTYGTKIIVSLPIDK
jgi:signal transduction histidine kinase